MSTCFVIQPFDNDGPFDKRYHDVIKPAIKDAGLEPYRVDEDPSVSVPIEDIERGIRESQLCVADITKDNPNVWFELGFAIASRRSVILLCSADRNAQFPFDVQHRHVIEYNKDSTRDFRDLKDKIVERVKAALQKEERLEKISSPLTDVEGLSQHETVALVSIAENLESPSDSIGAYTIRQDMERSGFTRIATFLALNALSEKRLISYKEDTDRDGNPYALYSLTQEGIEWLIKNQARLALRGEPTVHQHGYGTEDDDIPF